jgi:arylformamidase
MNAILALPHRTVSVDLDAPLDISIPLRAGKETVNAFHLPPMTVEPFRMGHFVGDVNQGGACNVNNIAFNPHGNGTHTECVGHISKEKHTIHRCLRRFFFLAEVITVDPEPRDGDRIITRDQVIAALSGRPEALIVRTLPNGSDKLVRHYSASNPPYLDAAAAAFMAETGILHLLLDLPSVDREEDGGHLLAHHAFWKYPEQPRTDCTITEMIYVPDAVTDGPYLLSFQIASFENDASPSKPVLYRMKDRV